MDGVSSFQLPVSSSRPLVGSWASLDGKPAPVVDGLTGEQRLLLGYAQAWRGKTRDDALRAQMASDPHSPRKYRVIGPTRMRYSRAIDAVENAARAVGNVLRES